MTYPNSLDEPHAWGTTRQFYLFVSTEIQSHFSQSIVSVISVISVISKVSYATDDLNMAIFVISGSKLTSTIVLFFDFCKLWF